MKCPACSTDTEGPETCASCGALLAAGHCRSCNAELAAGAKECPKCHAPVRPGAPARLAWIAMGAIAVAVVAGLLLSNQQPATPPPAALSEARPAPEPAPGGGAFANIPQLPPEAPALPPTARELADDLFNQAMAAHEMGRPEVVRATVPQALAAYRALGTLDDDATFHVSMLQLAGGDFPTARASAELLLAKNPNHLLALWVAAKSAAGAGDAASARRYNEQLLASYDAEVVKPLPEYLDHQRVLPMHRDEAKKALGQ